MRYEANAPGVLYTRLSKSYVANIKHGLRERKEDFWPDPEGEIKEYSDSGSSSWWRALDRSEDVLVYKNDDEEHYVSGSDLKVIQFQMGEDGTLAVEATHLTPGALDSSLAVAQSVAVRLQEMNTEISAGMKQGEGFVCVRTQSNDLRLAIDLGDVEALRPEQDIALLVLRSSLGKCVQEYLLGLLVCSQAYVWTDSEWGGGGDADRSSYFDEKGERFMDFLIYPKGGEVTSYLDEDRA